jgi:hypothetical protein
MSHIFKDTEGREWVVSVNIATVKRIKEKLQLDILDKIGITALEQIASDPIQLADVLFVVCERQAIERKVDDTAFGESLSGDALEAGSIALMGAIADFFPPSQRAVLQNALAKSRNLEQAASKRALAILDSGVVERAMERSWSQAESKLSKTTGSESA